MTLSRVAEKRAQRTPILVLLPSPTSYGSKGRPPRGVGLSRWAPVLSDLSS